MQIQGHEVGEDKDVGAEVTRKLLLSGGGKQGEHSDAQLFRGQTHSPNSATWPAWGQAWGKQGALGCTTDQPNG